MARRGENIYKRKDGRYEGRYLKFYDSNGKAVYGSVYSKSYTEVKQKLAGLKGEKKPQPIGSNIRLSQWLDNWIESETGIKETTRIVYKGHINNHIIPRMGKIRLKKLNGDILQAFISSLNLAPSTVKVVFTVLKSALSCAEENGLIANIWSKVKLNKKTKAEVTILLPNEQKRLERVLNDENDIGILICLYTGLRIGEVCALKWKDVDFERSYIHVNGTQARTKSGVTIIPPKSKSSIRTIPVPDFLMEKLRNIPHNGEFVLSNGGSFVDVRTYRRHFKNLLEVAKLPDIKFHALRHPYVKL